MDMIEYKGINYPIRTITIFEGTDEEVTIDVSSATLGDLIISNNDEDCEVDCAIACYIDDDLLNTMSDEELTKHVEEDYYF